MTIRARCLRAVAIASALLVGCNPGADSAPGSAGSPGDGADDAGAGNDASPSEAGERGPSAPCGPGVPEPRCATLGSLDALDPSRAVDGARVDGTFAATLDPSGFFHVAWERGGGVSYTTNRGGSFETVDVPVGSSPALTIATMGLAVDHCGEPAVVWKATDATAGDVLRVAIRGQSGWSVESVAAARPAGTTFRGDTRARAVFDGKDGLHVLLAVARTTGDGGFVNAIEDVHRDAGASTWSADVVPLDFQGAFDAVYQPSRGLVVAIRAAEGPRLAWQTGGWTPTAPPPSEIGLPSVEDWNSAVAIATARTGGDLHVVWSSGSGRDGDRPLRYARLTGTTWASEAIAVSDVPYESSGSIRNVSLDLSIWVAAGQRPAIAYSGPATFDPFSDGRHGFGWVYQGSTGFVPGPMDGVAPDAHGSVRGLADADGRTHVLVATGPLGLRSQACAP